MIRSLQTGFLKASITGALKNKPIVARVAVGDDLQLRAPAVAPEAVAKMRPALRAPHALGANVRNAVVLAHRIEMPAAPVSIED